MSQTWDSTAPAKTNEWDDDLLAMKNKFDTLQSSFSGSTAPTSPVAGQVWHDTGSGTLKAYPDSGSTWLAILKGDASLKIPVYRNDTCEGWTIDSSVTDRVLALKGGTGAYNANGGTNAGTAWATLKAHTHDDGTLASASHNHKVVDVPVGTAGDDHIHNSGGSEIDLPKRGSSGGDYFSVASGSYRLNADMYTSNATPSLSGNTGAQSTTEVRMQAALMTLQYPDLT